jgi:hypothetical protein
MLPRTYEFNQAGGGWPYNPSNIPVNELTGTYAISADMKTSQTMLETYFKKSCLPRMKKRNNSHYCCYKCTSGCCASFVILKPNNADMCFLVRSVFHTCLSNSYIKNVMLETTRKKQNILMEMKPPLVQIPKKDFHEYYKTLADSLT